MQKYHINKFSLSLIVFLVLIISLAISVNIYFLDKKNQITQPIDKYFPQEISFQKLIYLPPNFIILTGVSVTEEAQGAKKKIFSIPVSLIRFSPRELILNKRLFITEVRFFGLETSQPALLKFLRENHEYIIAFIQSLPKQDLKFCLRSAKLRLPQQGSSAHILTDFTLMVKKNFTWGSGSIIDKLQGKLKPLTLKYYFAGILLDEGLFLEDLEIIREDLYAKLSGSLDRGNLQLGGFALYNTKLEEQGSTEVFFDVRERAESLISRAKGTLKAAKLSGANIQIFDITCQARVSMPVVKIRDFGFSLNKIRVRIRGDVVLSEPISLELLLSAYPEDAKLKGGGNFKQIDLKILGSLEDKNFLGDGMLKLEFNKKDDSAGEEVKINFKKLTLPFSQYPNINLSAKELGIFYKTDKTEHSLTFEDFKSIANLQDERIKSAKFNSSLYDGLTAGRGIVDITEFPPKIKAIVHLKDVNANNLNCALTYFSKVYGKLSGYMSFSNYPELTLKGEAYMNAGYLDRFDFFEWLAGFFDLPSLRRIDFHYLSFEFLVNRKEAGLHEIDLKSQDVRLNGYFILGQKNLVSSRLSLGFTKELMRESLKLLPLLNILRREKFDFLDFDFQLSGDFESMNFQWLRSELKNKLQKLIPDFVERKLQRNIEDALAPLSQ